ncbi:Rid family hydrolase [Haloimpatiens sp. FM7330]
MQQYYKFAAVNEAHSSYFIENYLDRYCFEVGKLPKDAKIEIKVIALAE